MISKQAKEDYTSYMEKKKREKLIEIKEQIEKRIANEDTDQLRLDLEVCDTMLVEDQLYEGGLLEMSHLNSQN